MSSIQEKIDQAIKNQDIYFIGDALPPDFYAGFKQWLPLAESGDTKAMFNVAYCYVYGEGVDRNNKAGWDWYRKAAERDDPRALLALYNGYKGSNADQAEGYLQRALATGDGRAARIVSDREKALAEAARKAQAETDRQEQAKRAAPVVAELKALLERGDNESARRRAEQAVADGMTWAGSVVAATSLQINVNRTSRKHYTTIKGASMTTKVVEGVYQTSPVLTGHREYTFDGTVTNPTAYAVYVDFGETTGSRFVPAGGSTQIGKSGTVTSKWPVDGTLDLNDPKKTRVKMVLKRQKAARSSGGWSAWKIVGGLVMLYVLVKAYHLWQAWEIYQRYH
ncbi:Sel1 repeat-containing protein [Paraburkholderia unamae]|uniref:tetratricopeptide repeat protein n=1 Tax=Paraburkholderia unamae TaxID=219649 RepID=UPI000DC492DD|nr:SEL1-like repeat protein [Paraburkholderia unamae]RAR66869.1 Sel1 repeat-containing protein [Paraburkholderia unamae]